MKTTGSPTYQQGYVLNGSKTYITNGFLSDVVVVVAKTAPEKGAHGLSLFLVETGTPGFDKGTKLKKMGLKAQDTSELFFEDCYMPAEALLGEENNGFYYLMNELPQERLQVRPYARTTVLRRYKDGHGTDGRTDFITTCPSDCRRVSGTSRGRVRRGADLDQ